MPGFVTLNFFQMNHKIKNKVQRQKKVPTKKGIFSDFPYTWQQSGSYVKVIRNCHDTHLLLIFLSTQAPELCTITLKDVYMLIQYLTYYTIADI